jgi:hypothetical protein
MGDNAEVSNIFHNSLLLIPFCFQKISFGKEEAWAGVLLIR